MKVKSLRQDSKNLQITNQKNQHIRLKNWEISSMSNYSSGNDLDYGEQGTGEANASGSRTL